MINLYVKAADLLNNLRKDKAGVVSFEYVIVAACVVGAVGVAFGGSTSGAIHDSLSTALGKITAYVGTQVTMP